MSDTLPPLPERLRTYSADQELSDRYSDAMQEAADEIERLRGIVPETLEKLNDELCAENERLTAALASVVARRDAAISEAQDNKRRAMAFERDAMRYRELAAAVAEPVAYKCWHPVARAFYLSTEPPAPTRPDTGEPDEYFGGKVEPLYAAPPQREPLTDAQIEDCIDASNRAFNIYRSSGPRGQQITTMDDWKYWLARAIERAHGISAPASAPTSAPKEQA